jgi:hypothetical protein
MPVSEWSLCQMKFSRVMDMGEARVYPDPAFVFAT